MIQNNLIFKYTFIFITLFIYSPCFSENFDNSQDEFKKSFEEGKKPDLDKLKQKWVCINQTKESVALKFKNSSLKNKEFTSFIENIKVMKFTSDDTKSAGIKENKLTNFQKLSKLEKSYSGDFQFQAFRIDKRTNVFKNYSGDNKDINMTYFEARMANDNTLFIKTMTGKDEEYLNCYIHNDNYWDKVRLTQSQIDRINKRINFKLNRKNHNSMKVDIEDTQSNEECHWKEATRSYFNNDNQSCIPNDPLNLKNTGDNR